jgi:hypothetical protein
VANPFPSLEKNKTSGMDRRKVFHPVEGFSIIKGGALVHP